ncbi:MAG TPA: ABC transporter permease [Ignavibacteria bacterium]|mgnify:CR=1 FL=1|nr:ABC transporter permease [Ignavibacteria bacterium]
MEEKNNWTLEIRPKRHLLDVNLKELWHYRDLIVLFVRRDFVAKYKQTVLGPLWFLIQPLLTTLMFVVVFGNIAGIPTDGLPKILFYMTGITAWNYFADSLRATSNTFVGNAGIFGKVYFPRLVMPISTVISGLIQFFIQFLFLGAFMLYFGVKGADFSPNIYALLIPVLIILMAGLGLGFGIIISSMTTKYRDLTNLVSFGVQLWMYATPIIYPLSEIPQKYKWAIIANPVSPIVETFRFALLGKGTFDINHLLYSFGFMLVVLAAGILMFNKVEQSFMDTV